MLDPDRVQQHEEAAHEKRQWIRLTAQCNNRCTFCLDSDAHNGTNVPAMAIKAQILDGRKRGATRLILSGGEPTIHPNYVELIALGRRAGYRRIQTVTNGRMFAYPEFLQRCLDAGLDEITFSIHGPNARIHDALVGVKGAFEQEVTGLQAALAAFEATGRPIVNVDIVINRANVKHLVEMLESFIALGVREFDLLQVIPFGRAYHEGLRTLFYDLEEAQPHLQAAFAYAKRPDLHIWLNRFPPPYMEGYESLIQDPYKLNDEVRGRKEEFDRLLTDGTPLSCKSPDRCTRCYLESLCGTLDRTIDAVRDRALPIFRTRTISARPPFPVETVWIEAPDLAAAAAIAREFPTEKLHLDCADYAGISEGLLPVDRIVRAEARSPAAIDQLLSVGDFTVAVHLEKDTAAHLLARDVDRARLLLTRPNHERVTTERERACDLPAFFARFGRDVPTENIPACLSGTSPRERPRVLDADLLGDAGQIDVFGYTRRFILDHYYSKSRRCRDCAELDRCEGVHINHVRAHGYAPLQPIPSRKVRLAGS